MKKAVFIALIASFILFAAACNSASPAAPAVETTPAPTLVSPTAEPPAPTPQPEPTAVPAPLPCTVAFDTDRDGNREIYTVSPDGQATTNLTNNPADDENPAWAPDGSAIAFVSDRESPEGSGKFIFILDLKTGSVRQLTHLNGSDWPDWSPDGRRITFMAGEDIFVISADGSGKPTNLTNSPQKDYSPAFSPDGSKIAWIQEDQDRRNIFVMDAQSGGGAHPVTDNGRIDGFSWTIDGRILTGWGWKDREEICRNCLVNADGTGIVDAGGKGEIVKVLPFWTDDGDPVELAQIDRFDGNNEIYLIGGPFPDVLGIGIGQLNLTKNPADDRNPDWPALCGPGLEASAATLSTFRVEREKSPQEIVVGYSGDLPEDWQRKRDFQKACDELGNTCAFGELSDLLNQGVDAVVINTVDGMFAENMPDLNAAVEKGIPVLILGTEANIDGVYSIAVSREAQVAAGLEWMFAQMGGKGLFAYYDLKPELGDEAVVADLLKKYPQIELVSKRGGISDEIAMRIDVEELVREYPDLGAIWSNAMGSEIILGMAGTGIPGEKWPLVPCDANKRGLYIWKDRLKDFPAMKCVAVSSPPGIAYDAFYAAVYLATGAKIENSALGGKFGRTLFVDPLLVTNETLLDELKIAEYETDDFVMDAWMDPKTINEDWFEK